MSLFRRGPFAGGRPSLSSSASLRFRILSEDEDVMRASRGIGMPLSNGLDGNEEGEDGVALYGI